MHINRQKISEIINSSANVVVGIDLTGSEMKPCGWAVFKNGVVETERIRTDQEIMKQTIERNPGFIAIDAPLTLPRGRISVFDDDPVDRNLVLPDCVNAYC